LNFRDIMEVCPYSLNFIETNEELINVGPHNRIFLVKLLGHGNVHWQVVRVHE
jgi:hypothetical protein